MHRNKYRGYGFSKCKIDLTATLVLEMVAIKYRVKLVSDWMFDLLEEYTKACTISSRGRL